MINSEYKTDFEKWENKRKEEVKRLNDKLYYIYINNNIEPTGMSKDEFINVIAHDGKYFAGNIMNYISRQEVKLFMSYTARYDSKFEIDLVSFYGIEVAPLLNMSVNGIADYVNDYFKDYQKVTLNIDVADCLENLVCRLDIEEYGLEKLNKLTDGEKYCDFKKRLTDEGHEVKEVVKVSISPKTEGNGKNDFMYISDLAVMIDGEKALDYVVIEMSRREKTHFGRAYDEYMGRETVSKQRKAERNEIE